MESFLLLDLVMRINSVGFVESETMVLASLVDNPRKALYMEDSSSIVTDFLNLWCCFVVCRYRFVSCVSFCFVVLREIFTQGQPKNHVECYVITVSLQQYLTHGSEFSTVNSTIVSILYASYS